MCLESLSLRVGGAALYVVVRRFGWWLDRSRPSAAGPVRSVSAFLSLEVIAGVYGITQAATLGGLQVAPLSFPLLF